MKATTEGKLNETQNFPLSENSLKSFSFRSKYARTKQFFSIQLSVEQAKLTKVFRRDCSSAIHLFKYKIISFYSLQMHTTNN